ncbi:YihY/virulence factor BrkB family protein [Lacibacter sediminis]|uniref:YihY/virulence factor BrkB family protein n=1 Tax=Lacibacter sediminis TaxID=2760713 RepID=A0A7G5XBB4_9BACT|nr:YihY/virulence factor BrkB family protein [Lacibacter sediminis]QNA42767.1 YihY/virulence factor BrkB family protein [Lacibacter sediminis]
MRIEEFIYRLPVIRTIIRFSKRFRPFGFEGISLYEVSRFFVQQIKKGSLNQRAAAISFNFIMALPPACIFLFSLVPLFPIADQFYNEVNSFVREITPNAATRDAVENFLDDFFKRPKNSLLSIGFITSLYFSSNAVLGIIHSFNQSIHEKESKAFFAYRWKAIRLTFVIILIFIASILLLITQGALFNWLLLLLKIDSVFIKWLIIIVRWVVIVGLFFYSIAFIYKHAPSVEKKWKLISPGSIVASALIILFTFMFSYWINNFAAYTIYGSIGTILILMIFVNFISLVLLIGFELNLSIKLLKRQSDKRLNEEMSGAENKKEPS